MAGKMKKKAEEQPKAEGQPDPAHRAQRRLILCFDGTGNDYQARPNDTNIIKLLEMFDRKNPDQMHYYQPGIGTYTEGSSVNQSYLGALKTNVTQTIDTGIGTSFDHHVMAGYRFLMRYHADGDRIYVFGFSRGAFTARFLARMVLHVGLLSMGNEEMVPFAFKLYQDYEMDSDKWGAYMVRFRNAFCRHNDDKEKRVKVQGGFKVHFLGLFDTVSSIGTLEKGTVKPPLVQGTSRYVRHAVAIDERRVKFKAALLAQDRMPESQNKNEDQSLEPRTMKEVWFPGNHGDVGGGWHPQQEPEHRGFFGRFWATLKKSFKETFTNGSDDPPIQPNPLADRFQLSDIALKWMIDELRDVDKRWLEQHKGGELSWSPGLSSFKRRYARYRQQAVQGMMHDTMAFGGGSTLSKILLWNFMEYLPGIWRYEYHSKAKKIDAPKKSLDTSRTKEPPLPKEQYEEADPEFGDVTAAEKKIAEGETDENPSKPEEQDHETHWRKQYFPLNMGGCRDLVAGQTYVHDSLIECMEKRGKNYQPRNDVFYGDSSVSLHNALLRRYGQDEEAPEPDHPSVYFREQENMKTGDRPSDRIYRIGVTGWEFEEGDEH